MKLAEQALFLLNFDSKTLAQKKISFFSTLESIVTGSFQEQAEPIIDETFQPEGTANYSLAARLSSSHYEKKAKSEALMSAIKKIRTHHASKKSRSGRVIRQT